jgi:hypothetical protein
MNLLKDPNKLSILNTTRLIFINTLTYFDNYTYSS